jgi:importin-4
MINLSPQMMPVFAAVLGEPAEQLDDATRAKVVEMVKFIASKDVSLVDGNAVLMKYLGN